MPLLRAPHPSALAGTPAVESSLRPHSTVAATHAMMRRVEAVTRASLESFKARIPPSILIPVRGETHTHTGYQTRPHALTKANDVPSSPLGWLITIVTLLERSEAALNGRIMLLS